ncbi:MAG: STAS domain-containing protein [Anaerolineae bacterium]|nr:STAS domain-containing protein [Anaerolineae bacterium]
MQVRTRQYRRVDLVEVSGRVDSGTAPKLEAALQGIMGQERYRIAVDLSGVEYLSSAGLRVLVGALKRARRWNRGDLRLASVPARIREVLQLAGLDVLFKMYDSAVDAVGSF